MLQLKAKIGQAGFDSQRNPDRYFCHAGCCQNKLISSNGASNDTSSSTNTHDHPECPGKQGDRTFTLLLSLDKDAVSTLKPALLRYLTQSPQHQHEDGLFAPGFCSTTQKLDNGSKSDQLATTTRTTRQN